MAKHRRTSSSPVLVAFLTAALMAAGCGASVGLGMPGGAGATMDARGLLKGGAFPRGFMWGVATAGYQCEGGNPDNNWKAWEQAGKLEQPRKNAVDFWNRYPEDMDLARGMGLNAFRFSLEWSRIEPRPGEFDQAAIDHYRKMVDAAHARGLEPIVTLQHFAYPAWLDAGGAPYGFERPDAPRLFARYARHVAEQFRGKIRYWITINEPNVLAMGGYAVGFLPPGRMGWGPYTRSVAGIVDSHRAAYQALHEVDPQSQVSSNVFYLYADRPTTFDPGKIWGIEEDALLLSGAGVRSRDALGMSLASAGPGDAGPGAGSSTGLGRHAQTTRIPDGLAGPYLEDLGAQYLDFVAIDYYWGMTPSATFNVRKPYAWPVSPRGIFDACRDLWNTYRKPVLIAENGLATKNLAPRADGWTRESFMVHHLYHLREAVLAGVPVLGYIHWSLTDNYEWGDWTPRFGLYSVDGLNDPELKRVPTPAVSVYREIAASNGLPSRLVWKYMGIGEDEAGGQDR